MDANVHTHAQEGGLYRIHVREELTAQRKSWFADLHMRHDPTGGTVLEGVLDQAALHGVLTRVRDLGLTLLDVTWVHQPEQQREKY